MAARIQGNQRKGAGWTEFYESSRTQRRHARDQMATGASSAMSSCDGVLSGERGAAATTC